MRGPCECGVEHGPAPYRPDDIEATYDYTDEAGALLYQVVRKSGKRFLQRTPDGVGGWVWKLAGVRRVPYRLPELLAADRDATVYIVEGEKDVERLQAHLDAGPVKCVVTTNAGGAGKWHTIAPTAATALRGRCVFVIADADEPGRKHARQVLEALRGVARTVSALEPPAPHKDVSDLLAAGGGIGDLVPATLPLFVELPPPPVPAAPGRPPSVPPPWLDDESPTAPDDDREEVRLSSSSAKNVDALDAALAARAPDVFQRALQLVEIVAERKPGLVAAGAPVLRALNLHSLGTHVSRYVRCVRYSPPPAAAVRAAQKMGTPEPTGTWTETRAQADSALLPMLAYGRWVRIRPISGITESPIFRPDGTIGQTPGYDESTGYMFRPSCEYQAVPESPSQQDARLALESLRHVFCDFQYTSPGGAMVPIAALLTILARAAIAGNVPVFAFEASIQGAGKTMQGDIVHIIATGRYAPHSSFPHDDDEQRKAILSCALSASPVAFFDNVKGLFGGEAIEGVVTTGELKQRILGSSVDVCVSWLATILVTGNNMSMSEDMLRRSLMCRIEPDVEDPTARTEFAHADLPEWVRAERARLIVAALTILRAYACHGYPATGCGTMQSFQAWSRIIPGAILFAGGENVLQAIGTYERAGTDEHAALATFLRELPRLSLVPISARDILSALYPAPRKDEAPDGWDQMRAAIETLAPPRGMHQPEPLRFGNALRARKGQVVSGQQLVSPEESRNKVALWYVANPKSIPRS
jgi:5S rRNA maturation endonuclease (ribonuclease M5)